MSVRSISESPSGPQFLPMAYPPEECAQARPFVPIRLSPFPSGRRLLNLQSSPTKFTSQDHLFFFPVDLSPRGGQGLEKSKIQTPPFQTGKGTFLSRADCPEASADPVFWEARVSFSSCFTGLFMEERSPPWFVSHAFSPSPLAFFFAQFGFFSRAADLA